MRSDTRKILKVGSILIGVGAVAAMLMLTVLGGVTRQGPHTNLGWIALVVALGCFPLGAITLLLGLAKLLGKREG